MGALTPLFLTAALAIGVPIYLHLFQRHETRRVAFPALRYLERTEKEHARQIRFRQLILLILRVTVLLLLVGAGARLFFGGRGSAHPPTAAVLIVDNSMSSGLVVGEERILDRLKALAATALDGAGDEDRFWILPAGEPWRPALPGSAGEVRATLDALEPSQAQGDLTAALRRATQLLEASDFEHREIHLLSDLQATAFQNGVEVPESDIPVVVWSGFDEAPVNRALTDVLVGGGLPPLQGQRTQVSIAAISSDDAAEPTAVRLVVDERIRAAATVVAGTTTSVELPPAAAGWVQGFVDSDPDALRADDRRYFAYRSRPPSSVAVAGDPGVFVAQALGVLEQAGRVLPASSAVGGVLLSAAGQGLDGVSAGGTVVILPPADPTLLPGLNRRLADGGIPWRFSARAGEGAASLAGRRMPTPLADVTVRRWYALELTGSDGAAPSTLAEVAGAPWLVEGVDARERRYLLVASPLDPASSTLPISSSMVPFVEWAISEWAGAGAGPLAYEAGSHLPAPGGATHVRLPSGVDVEIDGTRTVRGTGTAGFYTFLAGDTTVSVVAVNPPPAESDLAVVEAGRLEQLLDDRVIEAEREGAWARAIFRARQGPELWWPLLLATVLLLLAEAALAAAGRVESRSRRPAVNPNATDVAA